MVIVAGSFEIKPDEREEFLAGRLESMRASRSEAGCLEYTMSADPIDAGRVVLFERWEDQASLDAHLAAMGNAPPPWHPRRPPSRSTTWPGSDRSGANDPVRRRGRTPWGSAPLVIRPPGYPAPWGQIS
jgi:quinol monooxygenase YgiN